MSYSPPPPPPALDWARLLPLVLPHLTDQADRCAVRLACPDWRAAADGTWRRAALSLDALLPPRPERLAERDCALLAAAGAHVLRPSLQEFCLLDVDCEASVCWLADAVAALGPSLPALHSLELSAPLACQVRGHSLLRRLEQLTQLRRLRLTDVAPEGGSMQEASCLRSLTELHLGLTAGSTPQHRMHATGVHHLAALPGLQVRPRTRHSCMQGFYSQPGAACTAAWQRPPWLPSRSTRLPAHPPSHTGAGADGAGGGGARGAVSPHGAHPPLLHGRRQRRGGPLAAAAHAPARPGESLLGE